MSDFLPEEGRTTDDPYSTFNQFFTRRVTDTARPFAEGAEFPPLVMRVILPMHRLMMTCRFQSRARVSKPAHS